MNLMLSKIKHIRSRVPKLIILGLAFICLIINLFIPSVYANGDGQVILTVNQTFNIDEASSPPENTFSYLLTPNNIANPMPKGNSSEGYSFSIEGTSAVQIGISFSTAGTYTYELRCVNTAAAGYSYDIQVYNIEIHIKNDLTSSVIFKKSDGFKASEIHFAHHYKVISSETNTHSEETVTISGKKIWEHGNAPVNEQPDHITVLIKEGENTVKEIKVTKLDGWKWSVQLPRYDNDGNTIHYAVGEANVPRYTHKVSDTDILNTYVSSGYPGDSPNTGDIFNMRLWLTIMAVSCCFLIILLLAWRRKRDEVKQQY